MKTVVFETKKKDVVPVKDCGSNKFYGLHDEKENKKYFLITTGSKWHWLRASANESYLLDIATLQDALDKAVEFDGNKAYCFDTEKELHAWLAE